MMSDIRYTNPKPLTASDDGEEKEKAKKNRIVYVYSSTAGFTPDQTRPTFDSPSSPRLNSSRGRENKFNNVQDDDEMEAASEASDSTEPIELSASNMDQTCTLLQLTFSFSFLDYGPII